MLSGSRITVVSHLQEGQRVVLAQQTVDLFFGFAHVLHVLAELLGLSLEFALTALQLAVHGGQRLSLLSRQHVLDLLVLHRQRHLLVGRRVLESRERPVNRWLGHETGRGQKNRNTSQDKNMFMDYK